MFLSQVYPLSLCHTTLSWAYIVIDINVLCQRYEDLDRVIHQGFLTIFNIDKRVLANKKKRLAFFSGCPPVREKSGKFDFSSRSGKRQGILQNVQGN